MRRLALFAILAATLVPHLASARDWYVSVARGKGKEATKEAPAKDLGNILSALQPGDTVHIAEGVYLGRGENGSNKLTVPVSIIGGYDDAFTTRDPWGKHRTIFGGNNTTKNYTVEPSLYVDLSKFTGPAVPMVFDGLIVDMGYRNHYADEKQNKLIPSANPKTGENPSPSLGAFVINVSKSDKFDKGPRWEITVRNNIVINAYQNQAALAVSGFKGSTITIENNLVAQTSGYGLWAGSRHQGDDPPSFLIKNNTVLFSWDSGFSQCSSIGFDGNVKARVENNVFAFSDINGVDNGKGAKGLLLKDNLITGARTADYVEGGMKLNLATMLDEADRLDPASGGNVSAEIKVPVSKDFALAYGSRVVVDREKLEADVKATNSGANALRSMLGLPVQAGAVAWPKIDVYINRISIDDAIAAGRASYEGKYGSSLPAAK